MDFTKFRFPVFKRTSLSLRSRFLSSTKVTEDEVLAILRKTFPAAKEILVKDTSGGCGAMFKIMIEAPEFDGLSIKNQHATVYDALKSQIKNMHGLHVETKVLKEIEKD